MQRHERAFAQEPDAWRYGLSWTTLEAALVPARDRSLGDRCTDVDRQQVRERERALAERIADQYTGY